MMTRKDYMMIAEGIRHQRVSAEGDVGYARAHLRMLAEDYADAFGEDNPKFDKRRFLEACGVGIPDEVPQG